MPTYDYICHKCSHVFEVFLGIKQVQEVRCPKCENVAGRKISGGTGVIYKGTGFYTTDYNPAK